MSAHDRPRHVCAYCLRWFDSSQGLTAHQRVKRHTVADRQEGGNVERKLRAYDHARRKQIKAALPSVDESAVQGTTALDPESPLPAGRSCGDCGRHGFELTLYPCMEEHCPTRGPSDLDGEMTPQEAAERFLDQFAGRTGSEAYTAEGKEELDELNSSNPAPGGEEET